MLDFSQAMDELGDGVCRNGISACCVLHALCFAANCKKAAARPRRNRAAARREPAMNLPAVSLFPPPSTHLKRQREHESAFFSVSLKVLIEFHSFHFIMELLPCVGDASTAHD